MYHDSFLARLVTSGDPLEPILEWAQTNLLPLIDLNKIEYSYDAVEQELRDFERWLHHVWGTGFYQALLGRGNDCSLKAAFTLAAGIRGNILVCDGFSVREALVLKLAFPGRVDLRPGLAPAPTTTETAAVKVFQNTDLKTALTGHKLYWGHRWKGQLVEDISKPPRIGRQTGQIFLSHYPDAPLHHAVSYGVTHVQSLSEIIKKITTLVEELSRNAPLLVTGDHGYLYMGENPNKYMWMPLVRRQRYGEQYKSNYIMVEGVNVAVGRHHSPVTDRSNTKIVHGGVSLTESLVPVATVHPEADA